MLAIESIINYYQKKKRRLSTLGICPNCWGHQKYQGHFQNTTKKERINFREIGERRGWLLAYASSKLQGIRFKKRNLIEKMNLRSSKLIN